MLSVKVTTGQFVAIEQPLASVGERIAAQLIDWFMVTGVVIFIILPLLNAGMPEWAAVVLLVVVPWLYPLVMEAFNKGRTVGKASMNIMVARSDGSAATLGDIALRWLLFPVDVGFACVGVVAILFTSKNQRLGDLAAGTIVISTKNESYFQKRAMLSEFGFVNEGYRPFYRRVAQLTPAQARVISRTLGNDSSRSRIYYINKLADKVMHTLRILPAPGASAEQFLYAVLNDYYYYSSTVEV